jgi:hypothetical protein
VSNQQQCSHLIWLSWHAINIRTPFQDNSTWNATQKLRVNFLGVGWEKGEEVTAQFKALMRLYLSNTRILGSTHIRGINAWKRLFMLCFPAQVPCDESTSRLYCYRMSKRFADTNLFFIRGRDIAQVVGRRLPTAAARVRPQVRLCRFRGEKNITGAGFLPVFRFPLPILILINAPFWSIIRGWFNRPISGRCTERTQFHSNPWK